MRGNKRLCLMMSCLLMSPLAIAESLTANTVVANCEYKSPGKDQRSMMEVTLINSAKAEKKNVYRRLWRAAENDGDMVDKMVLYTVSPLDAAGTGFLRWGYKASSGKAPDQWLYLPAMKKLRRVSVRDPGDSFLGSDLSYGDIDDRPVTADRHEFVGEFLSDPKYYVIDSAPLDEPKLYSYKRSWYEKAESLERCVRVKTEYYDKAGDLLKTQRLSWQSVAGSWAWDVVSVDNVQTNHSSVFRVYDVEFDVGLSERLFEDRALKRGYRE